MKVDPKSEVIILRNLFKCSLMALSLRILLLVLAISRPVHQRPHQRHQKRIPSGYFTASVLQLSGSKAITQAVSIPSISAIPSMATGTRSFESLVMVPFRPYGQPVTPSPSILFSARGNLGGPHLSLTSTPSLDPTSRLILINMEQSLNQCSVLTGKLTFGYHATPSSRNHLHP